MLKTVSAGLSTYMLEEILLKHWGFRLKGKPDGVFAKLLSGATIDDGGMGVRSDVVMYSTCYNIFPFSPVAETYDSVLNPAIA